MKYAQRKWYPQVLQEHGRERRGGLVTCHQHFPTITIASCSVTNNMQKQNNKKHQHLWIISFLLQFRIYSGLFLYLYLDLVDFWCFLGWSKWGGWKGLHTTFAHASLSLSLPGQSTLIAERKDDHRISKLSFNFSFPFNFAYDAFLHHSDLCQRSYRPRM